MSDLSEGDLNPSIGLWRRLVARGFRLLYGKLAWTYDLVAWSVSFGQWKDWVGAVLPHIVGARVLELGHGPGHLQQSLMDHNLCAAGIDISPQMGRLALKRLSGAGLQPSLVQARAQTLPFGDRAFDSVVATFPTSYIQQPETLAEIARILDSGGRAVVVLGAQLTSQGPLARVIEWLYQITGQRDSGSRTSWEQALGGVGLKPHWLRIDLRGSQVSLLVMDRVTPDDTN